MLDAWGLRFNRDMFSSFTKPYAGKGRAFFVDVFDFPQMIRARVFGREKLSAVLSFLSFITTTAPSIRTS